MRLADENYFQLARRIPCKEIEYFKGDQPEKINPCDKSSTNEFSLSNLIEAQKWIYEHQHPADCSNKRFAIIRQYAWSGFGSTVHQIAWALAIALSEDRIAVYQTPGNWIYGACNSTNPDCYFLPISNCSIPTTVDENQTIYINAALGHWHRLIFPSVFRNRTFHWYRAHLVFYLMRFKPEIFDYIQKHSTRFHRPYIAVYVRRSDKVQFKEMSQAYALKQYFDLFDNDARRVNISNVYLNSEDVSVFNEFIELNKEKNGFYNLFSINVTRDVTFHRILNIPMKARRKIVLEFLTDLYVEVHADLHVGTLTSNWCRLVDELRQILGKTILFYTPEKKYFSD